MPFTAHDLRYQAEQTYPALYAFLQQRAQHFLGALRFDAYEVDQVVSHVVEQLVRLGLLGGGDRTPLTVMDELTAAQFYAFLNRSARNKAIDRLRKRRLQVATFSELEVLDENNREEDFLNDIVEPGWTPPPFATPEEAALAVSSQQEMRELIKSCLKNLQAAPRQFMAMLQELEEVGADELIQQVRAELAADFPIAGLDLSHSSQHKDHAHKKLRHCLQKSSANLTVMIALRLTEYTEASTAENSDQLVEVDALTQGSLSIRDVYRGLDQLKAKGYLEWNGGKTLLLTRAQKKNLRRFYQEE